MRWWIAVVALAACKEQRTPPVEDGEEQDEVEPAVVPIAVPPEPKGPRGVRLMTKHCASTGQQVRTSRAQPSERQPDRRFAVSGARGKGTGIVVDTDPLVIDGIPDLGVRLAARLDWIRVGDIVNYDIVGMTDGSGPELAMHSVIAGIEPAIGAPDRVGTAVVYRRFAKQTLSVRDDGTVLANGRPTLTLTDAELASLMKTFGDVAFTAAPLASPGAVDAVTLTCGRSQTARISEPGLSPLAAALDAIGARIDNQTSYRLQWARRDKVEWMEWKEAVPIADIIANQRDRNAWRTKDPRVGETRYDLERTLAKKPVPTVFVRDGGKVFVVELEPHTIPPSISLLSAYECTPAGPSRCRLWTPVEMPFDPKDLAGVTVPRGKLAALGLQVRDDLERTEHQATIAVVGDYVYSGLAVWRKIAVAGVPGTEPTSVLRYSRKQPITKWSASAPPLAGFQEAKRRVADPNGRARTDLKDPMYTKAPAAIAKFSVEQTYFEEAGVIYGVRSACNNPVCGEGMYFALQVSPAVVKPWTAVGLSLADVPPQGLEVSAAQYAANQRLLEQFDHRGVNYVEGSTIYLAMDLERPGL